MREEVLRPGEQVRCEQGHQAARVQVRGRLQVQLHARVWI